MTYEPLHHKYRPKTFTELVGQEAIATTLTNAIRSERIAPAYLFTGARGTGKTSSARILAKSLNCLAGSVPTEQPCGQCEACTKIASGSALDVIEIDAASNTGVDNIREIIERSQFAPVQCRYKVYVVDECHMLSTAAFNALLKTLEEPPARVVFVLATTDPQRVLPTIISRCQRFDFRRIPLEAMVSHLQHIASQENINITADAITLVAQVAQGGLRDAESLLDQLSLLPGQVSVEQVWDLVGAVPERDLMVLTKAIASDNVQAVLEQCRHLMDRGREPLIVLQNMAGFYRDLLIAKTAPTCSNLVAITPPTWKQLCELATRFEVPNILQGQQHLKNSEAQIKNTTQPRLWLEVTLLGLLPRALSADSVVRSEDRSPSSQSQSSVKNRAETNRDRVSPVTPDSSTQRPPGVSEQVGHRPTESPQQQNPDHTTQSQQLPHPTTQHVDTSTIDANQTQITPPTQASQASQASAPTSIQPRTVQQTDDSITAASNHVKSTPASTAQKSTDPEDDVERIWQQVLDHLQPRATRELLRQHCRLLTFNRSVALIAISSEPLLKMAQSRLANIEAAFESVYQSKVKVTLQAKLSESFNTAPANEPTSPGRFIEPTAEESTTPAKQVISEINEAQRGNSGSPLGIRGQGGERENVKPSSRQTNSPITSTSVSDVVATLEASAVTTLLASVEHNVVSVQPYPSGQFANKNENSETAPQELAGQTLGDTLSFGNGFALEQGIRSDHYVQASLEEIAVKTNELQNAVTTAPASLTLNQSPRPLLAQNVGWDADEVENAITSLKQFFEGEIVDLTDDFYLSESVITHQPPDAPDVATSVIPEQGIGPTTDLLELELEDEQDQYKLQPATSKPLKSVEIAVSQNIQTDSRLENLQYDEDGDIAF